MLHVSHAARGVVKNIIFHLTRLKREIERGSFLESEKEQKASMHALRGRQKKVMDLCPFKFTADALCTADDADENLV